MTTPTPTAAAFSTPSKTLPVFGAAFGSPPPMFGKDSAPNPFVNNIYELNNYIKNINSGLEKDLSFKMCDEIRLICMKYNATQATRNYRKMEKKVKPVQVREVLDEATHSLKDLLARSKAANMAEAAEAAEAAEESPSKKRKTDPVA